jgi:hypothetical protein
VIGQEIGHVHRTRCGQQRFLLGSPLHGNAPRNTTGPLEAWPQNDNDKT